jgi:hypothetical protein
MHVIPSRVAAQPRHVPRNLFALGASALLCHPTEVKRHDEASHWLGEDLVRGVGRFLAVVRLTSDLAARKDTGVGRPRGRSSSGLPWVASTDAEGEAT